MGGNGQTGPATHATIDTVDVSGYTVPTDAPESDGTLQWESTTIVVAEVSAAHTGLGYTYAHPAAGDLIAGTLRDVVVGRPMAVGACWDAMVDAVRNLNRPGWPRTRSRPSTRPSGTRKHDCLASRSPRRSTRSTMRSRSTAAAGSRRTRRPS